MIDFDARIDYYGILRIRPSATASEVTKAFRRAVSRGHPDRKGGSDRAATERLVQINEAGRVLRDPALRARYDAARARGAQATGAHAPAEPDRAHAPHAHPTEPEPDWKRAQEKFETVWVPRMEAASSPGWAFFTAVVGFMDAYLTAKGVPHMEVEDW
jgi:DnaJ-class molecular chaperone